MIRNVGEVIVERNVERPERGRQTSLSITIMFQPTIPSLFNREYGEMLRTPVLSVTSHSHSPKLTGSIVQPRKPTKNRD